MKKLWNDATQKKVERGVQPARNQKTQEFKILGVLVWCQIWGGQQAMIPSVLNETKSKIQYVQMTDETVRGNGYREGIWGMWPAMPWLPTPCWWCFGRTGPSPSAPVTSANNCLNGNLWGTVGNRGEGFAHPQNRNKKRIEPTPSPKKVGQE